MRATLEDNITDASISVDGETPTGAPSSFEPAARPI